MEIDLTTVALLFNVDCMCGGVISARLRLKFEQVTAGCRSEIASFWFVSIPGYVEWVC
jgi:hypothetical protein